MVVTKRNLESTFGISKVKLGSVLQCYFILFGEDGQEGLGHVSLSPGWCDTRQLDGTDADQIKSRKDMDMYGHVMAGKECLESMAVIDHPSEFVDTFLENFCGSSYPALGVMNAIAAIDMALWDLHAKSQEKPVFELDEVKDVLHDRKADRVKVMHTVGLGANLENVQTYVGEHGLTSLKVKVTGYNMDEDVETLIRMGNIFEIEHIVADFNEGCETSEYLAHVVSLLPEHVKAKLDAIEQPFKRNCLDQRIPKLKGIRVILDEGYVIHNDIVNAKAEGYTDVALKISPRPFSETLRTVEEAEKLGMGLWVMDLTNGWPIAYSAALELASRVGSDTGSEFNGRFFYGGPEKGSCFHNEVAYDPKDGHVSLNGLDVGPGWGISRDLFDECRRGDPLFIPNISI